MSKTLTTITTALYMVAQAPFANATATSPPPKRLKNLQKSGISIPTLVIKLENWLHKSV